MAKLIDKYGNVIALRSRGIKFTEEELQAHIGEHLDVLCVRPPAELMLFNAQAKELNMRENVKATRILHTAFCTTRLANVRGPVVFLLECELEEEL